jgi:DNA gyrase/topoisomerase IV subunit A
MSSSSFDTHAFFNELKSAGFSEQQAEVITKLQKTTITTTLEQAKHDYQLDDLTTKRDLKELELSLESRIKDTELKIVESKADLIRWVVGVGVLQTALITALLIKLSAAI